MTVLDYQAKPIYVIGEVDNPGQYVMSQPWTLTEAILVAGGLDVTSGSTGISTDGCRRKQPRPHHQQPR